MLSPKKNDVISAYAEYFTYRVAQLSARLNVQASRLLRDSCDLSPVQWRLLALIHVSAPVNSATLVRSIAMDAGQFSRSLKSLINDGLIKSRVDTTDHRRQVLSLTSKGIKRYKLAAPIMKKRRDALMHGVSKADRDAFFRVLDHLDSKLSDSEPLKKQKSQRATNKGVAA